MRVLNYLFCSLFVVVLSSCAPRGETQTMDEILESSVKRYEAALGGDVDPRVKGDLSLVASYLDNILEAREVGDSSRELAEKLYELTAHAGFTARPAIGELAKQYTQLAEQSGEGVKEGRRKLLVSRTYTILAQELETMKFAL